MSRLAIGTFVLDRPVGTGAMGKVWRGEHGPTGTPVAVKVLTSARDHDDRVPSDRRRHDPSGCWVCKVLGQTSDVPLQVAVADSAAVAAGFNAIDRVADATGIPIDEDRLAPTASFRRDLGIDAFPSRQT